MLIRSGRRIPFFLFRCSWTKRAWTHCELFFIIFLLSIFIQKTLTLNWTVLNERTFSWTESIDSVRLSRFHQLNLEHLIHNLKRIPQFWGKKCLFEFEKWNWELHSVHWIKLTVYTNWVFKWMHYFVWEYCLLFPWSIEFFQLFYFNFFILLYKENNLIYIWVELLRLLIQVLTKECGEQILSLIVHC